LKLNKYFNLLKYLQIYLLIIMYSSYQIIQNTFKQYECALLTTEEEYNLLKVKRPKYKYTAQCGHEHIICYSSFRYRNSGMICPPCMVIKNAKIAKERVKDDKLKNIIQELDCINYFKQLITEEYTVVKAFDGCKADIIIKPKHILENKWLGIQVKTCAKSNRHYMFALAGKDYTNNMILCICTEDKKMWGFLQENIQTGITKLSIGLKKSKYDPFELTLQNLNKILNENYQNMSNQFDIINLPTNIYQQREQEFYKYRESKIDFLKFIYNDMEAQVFDFKIGDLKIQEKVGGLLKDRNNTYWFGLCKNDGKTQNKNFNQVQYSKGDNDFYWLNCSDKKHFYIIHENIFIKQGFINSEDKKRFILKFNPYSRQKPWYNEYLFDYDNINKEQIIKILNINI
jgi:hypothetical protein